MNRLLAKIHREGPLAQIDADHMAQLILRPKASGLFTHVLDQLGPLNAIGKPGEILHQRSERKLASRLMPFNHQRFEVGTGGVERRSMAGATGPNDDNVANVLHIQVPRNVQLLDCQTQIWMQVALASRPPPLRYFFFGGGFVTEDDFGALGLLSATPATRSSSSGTVVRAPSRPR